MKKFLYLFAASLVAFSFASCEPNKPSQPKDDDDDSKKPSYTHKDAIEGCLPGLFAINEKEQVYFSQGNLRYSMKNNYYTYEFADKQYNIIGEGNQIISSMIPYSSIDLFGWGTGINPDRSSEDNADYAEFNDWGEHRIENGGNEPELWRTLTNEEWLYLFRGRPNAIKRFGFGHIINEDDSQIDGVILLPDNWTLPEDVAFFSAKDKGVEWVTNEGSDLAFYTILNDDDATELYTHNEYKVADKTWEKMENAGAVFLPAAGYREGTNAYMSRSYYGPVGGYWSSTPYTEGKAYFLYFSSNRLHPSREDNYYGRAVRLVR